MVVIIMVMSQCGVKYVLGDQVANREVDAVLFLLLTHIFCSSALQLYLYPPMTIL